MGNIYTHLPVYSVSLTDNIGGTMYTPTYQCNSSRAHHLFLEDILDKLNYDLKPREIEDRNDKVLSQMFEVTAKASTYARYKKSIMDWT